MLFREGFFSREDIAELDPEIMIRGRTSLPHLIYAMAAPCCSDDSALPLEATIILL